MGRYLCKSLLIISLFLSLSCCGGERRTFLYAERGGPSFQLLELLHFFSLEHDGSWCSINEELQQKCFQRSKERWEFTPLSFDNPECAYFLFSQLGMTQTVYPKRKKYDYAVILGSTLQPMRQQVWFLKTLWDRGIKFKKIIVLTGDRPLSPELEGDSELFDPKSSKYPFRKDWKFSDKKPKNETEMIELVFEQLDLPPIWQKMEIQFVDTPAPPNKRRPTTADTFNFWLQSKPRPGSTLIITCQPFLGRQDTIARKFLPKPFRIETVGKGFTCDELIKFDRGLAILLDELARWVYEEVGVMRGDCSFNNSRCL